MFGHHQHHHRCGPRGFGAMRGSRGWGPFSIEWEVRDEREGGRGRRRVFSGDELRLVLLALIAQTPRHGYDLIREIEERSGGAYAPSPGVVYPSLTMLADMDLIAEQAAEGAKKRFAVTETGQSHLAEREDEVTALLDRLSHMGERRERGSRGPVKRAMGNLRQALLERIGQAEVEDETLHRIAAILDEATQKIERA